MSTKQFTSVLADETSATVKSGDRGEMKKKKKKKKGTITLSIDTDSRHLPSVRRIEDMIYSNLVVNS